MSAYTRYLHKENFKPRPNWSRYDDMQIHFKRMYETVYWLFNEWIPKFVEYLSGENFSIIGKGLGLSVEGCDEEVKLRFNERMLDFERKLDQTESVISHARAQFLRNMGKP